MNNAETIAEGSSRGTLRSILAVLAGLIAIFVVTTITDIVMHATGIFPPMWEPMSDGLWVLATAYRIVYGVLGGYITARLAPSRPVAHAVALGLIGVALSTAATIATWNYGPEFGPKWYTIGLVLISVPTAWAGAFIFEKKYTAERRKYFYGNQLNS